MKKHTTTDREVVQWGQRQQVGQVQRDSESALALCTRLRGHTIPPTGNPQQRQVLAEVAAEHGRTIWLK